MSDPMIPLQAQNDKRHWSAGTVLAWSPYAGHPDDGSSSATVIPTPFTIGLRARAPEDGTETTLLSIALDEPRFSCLVRINADTDRILIVVEVATGFRDAPLTLRASAPRDAKAVSHEVFLVVASHRIAMFLDGSLADEEWPVGVPSSIDPAQFRFHPDRLEETHVSGRLLEQAAVWNRPFTDEEIESGSKERETPVGPYWEPAGENTGVGDCMPFFDGWRYHLFYLFDRRAHRSKWGLGAHQWAHASTDDLRHWVHHPMAVPITDEREGSICTGSVFLHDGVYRAYYATRTVDGSPAPLGFSVSDDGVRFRKTGREFHLPAPYNGASARDPHVFRNPRDGRFHMVVTTSLLEEGRPSKGCLARLVSTDLERWELTEPLLTLDSPDEPECPEWFEWNGTYYLVFSIGGAARVRMATEPLGPWRAPENDFFDGARLGVMKSAWWRDGRRIGAGFLRDERNYAGRVVFREIVRRADGSLGTDWPAEMVPDAGLPVRLNWISPETEQDGQPKVESWIRIDGRDSERSVRFDGLPERFLLRFGMRAAPEAGVAGIRLSGGDGHEIGFVEEVRFDRLRRRIEASGGESLDGVEWPEDGIRFDLLRRDGVLDLRIDGGRTLACLADPRPARRLVLFASGGEAVFDSPEARPLDNHGV